MTKHNALVAAQEKSILYDDVFCVIQKGDNYCICIDYLINKNVIIYKSFFGGEEILF